MSERESRLFVWRPFDACLRLFCQGVKRREELALVVVVLVVMLLVVRERGKRMKMKKMMKQTRIAVRMMRPALGLASQWGGGCRWLRLGLRHQRGARRVG